MWQKTKTKGLVVRHEKACAANAGGRCRGCSKSFRVRYWEDGKAKWSRTFKDENEAQSWLVDHKRASTPEVRAEAQTLVPFNELADQWFELAGSGAISQKGGRAYSAGTLDTYRRMYDNHVRHELGDRPAHKLTGKDWQSWLDSRVRIGLKRNSVSVTLNVVRSVYRWACSPNRAMLAVNATAGLELPANDETPRNRVATPEEAKRLLAALEPFDRTAFGLSLYAGLRNMERLPLEWSDVDFKAGKIKVRISKSDSGIRTLPMVAPLRTILRAEWMRQGQPKTGLVCIGPKGGPPEYNSQLERARKAWRAAGLQPIGFHECRHTFISTMIASGLNAKAVSVLAGHGSIGITFDRYGHLFAGHEDEAGTKLDAIYAAELTNELTNELSKPSEMAL